MNRHEYFQLSNCCKWKPIYGSGSCSSRKNKTKKIKQTNNNKKKIILKYRYWYG